MFNMLTTCYLFLGGAGAGALAVLGLLECANARRRFAFAPGPPTRVERAFALPDEFFARAWPVCLVVLAGGALCLLIDLGRPDRLLNMLVSPRLSAIAVGTYAVAAAIIVAATFSVLELFDGLRVRAAFVGAAGALGVAAGSVTMVYTGVLLQGLSSVLFWQTPLLPAAFALSSVSCGIACVFLAAAFVEVRRPFTRQLARLARFDGAVVVLEALVLVAYLAWALSGEGTRASAQALVAGELSWVFWGCLGVAGLALPLVLERFITYGNSRTQLLWIGAFLLVGGFALRFVVVGAAAFDVTQMADGLFGLTIR